MKTLKEILSAATEEMIHEWPVVIASAISPRYQDCDPELCDKQVTDLLKKNEVPGIYLYGDCGVGKTYTLFSVYKTLIANQLRKESRIINATVWMTKLRENYDDKYLIRELRDELKQKKYLLIDDLGADRTTDYATDVLYEVINYRHDYLLPTFFTSNLSVKELAQKYSDRIASRIAGMCEVIKLGGEDRRIN